MDLRFGRDPATRPVLYPSFGPTFDVEGYLHYHGEALVKRLMPTAISISRGPWTSTMLVGMVGRRRGCSRIAAPVSLVGIRSDWLFPAASCARPGGPSDQRSGKRLTYHELDSPHGHDAFLKEWDQMTAAIGPFIASRCQRSAAT